MSLIKNILRYLMFSRFNVCKTLLVNFFYLSFRDACRLPILVHGKCKIAHIGKGKIVIKGRITPGIISIGDSDPVRSFYSKSYIDVLGCLELETGAVLRRGISLLVMPKAVLKIGRNTSIGTNTTIISRDSIIIKSHTSIGNNVTIMDTDFHFVLDRHNRTIKKSYAPIVIGENNWIGAWCTVKKGAQLPKGTIVAGPYSMVGKNYIGLIPEYSMIAGSPAKLVTEGVQRIKDLKAESILRNYFLTEKASFVLPKEEDIDIFCIGQKL